MENILDNSPNEFVSVYLVQNENQIYFLYDPNMNKIAHFKLFENAKKRAKEIAGEYNNCFYLSIFEDGNCKIIPIKEKYIVLSETTQKNKTHKIHRSKPRQLKYA